MLFAKALEPATYTSHSHQSHSMFPVMGSWYTVTLVLRLACWAVFCFRQSELIMRSPFKIEVGSKQPNSLMLRTLPCTLIWGFFCFLLRRSCVRDWTTLDFKLRFALATFGTQHMQAPCGASTILAMLASLFMAGKISPCHSHWRMIRIKHSIPP
jgi:hypothetical protein